MRKPFTRKPFIAGNWKMNKTVAETRGYIAEFLPLVEDAEADVALCVPFTDIAVASEALAGSKVGLGAQNVSWADKGAYTGEISAEMLVEAGVKYVIIGHSERRAMFGDTDKTVNMRTIAALKAGLIPILCVGETEQQRMTNKTNAVLRKQMKAAFENIAVEDAVKVIIAYEPIWAIGTGKTATPEDAEETCAFVRSLFSRVYKKVAAKKVRVLYGGSMNAANAKDLMAKENIDGGLIGGASLVAGDFVKVVKY